MSLDSHLPPRLAPMTLEEAEQQFPVEEYVVAQRKWIGRTMIITPTIVHAIGDSLQDKTVLDVGCGAGTYSNEFVQWGAKRVVGIDRDHEMILKCRSKFGTVNSNLEFRESSTLDLDDKKEYDVAMAIFVLQFCQNYDELRLSLLNIARSLKPGGVLYAFVPNGVGDLNATNINGIKFGATLVMKSTPPVDGERLRVDFYSEKGDVIGSSPVTFFYRSTYESCCKQAGFAKVDWVEPVVSDDGIAHFGRHFFDSYFHPPKDIMFRAYMPPLAPTNNVNNH